MTNPIDQNVLRCAKQLYTNLQLKDRSRLLEKNTMPPEVTKMESLLALTDKTTLNKFIRTFFSWTPPTNRKKNLQDFIILLDKELDVLST